VLGRAEFPALSWNFALIHVAYFAGAGEHAESGLNTHGGPAGSKKPARGAPMLAKFLLHGMI
jgi:hypothetical protein